MYVTYNQKLNDDIFLTIDNEENDDQRLYKTIKRTNVIKRLLLK